MAANSPGRPPKQAAQKRHQLHFSLYDEDIQRLEQLTDNRSEFIRQCIAQSWTAKNEQALTFKVPKRLVAELLPLLKQCVPPHRAALVETLIQEVLAAKPG
ncbi:MAG: hypothetical protein M3Q45_15200 [Chloroflexota bacterium]|nr:hypothetical protein [Chloroflexota bacterium]